MRRKEWGYGFFPGGDPRDFHPDEESSTEEERASHKAACERWNAGYTTALPGSCVHGPGHVLTLSGFGLGSYSYDAEAIPWDPKTLRHSPLVWPRIPRRIKKRLAAAGWSIGPYGWTHESWLGVLNAPLTVGRTAS